jgi:hypothetical protein
MIKSIILWIIKSLWLILLTIVSFPLAPIFALFIVYEEEVEVTGFPSLLPGTPRAFLIPCLRIWQTPDAPLDEFWYGGYTGWPRDGRTQAEYDSSAWLRYLCRVTWLWRNAAYGFGAKVGYDVKGLVVTSERDEEHLWRTGVNCFSYWIFKNDAGDIGWCVRAQFYYYKKNCLEMYLGYKLPSVTVDGKKFVAIQFTPFRSYPK